MQAMRFPMAAREPNEADSSRPENPGLGAAESPGLETPSPIRVLAQLERTWRRHRPIAAPENTVLDAQFDTLSVAASVSDPGARARTAIIQWKTPDKANLLIVRHQIGW